MYALTRIATIEEYKWTDLFSILRSNTKKSIFCYDLNVNANQQAIFCFKSHIDQPFYSDDAFMTVFYLPKIRIQILCLIFD